MFSGNVNDGNLAEKFLAMAVEFEDLADKAVHRAGTRMWTQVRANASTGTHIPGDPHIPGTGPGPNVATGDYRRSIKHTKGKDIGPFSVIASNAPQAFRLEYGFTGTDSLGRNYNQPPYPHWRPAAANAREFLDAEMLRALRLAKRRMKES